jgi:hypothetical protein
MKCRYENCSDHTNKKTVCEGPCCLLVTNSPIYIRAYPPYWLIIIFPNYPSPTGLHPWSPPWVPDLAQWNPNYPWKAVSPIPRCNPWCWNIYPYLPQKLPSYVGKYSIYGAYGLGICWFYCNYLLMLNAGNFREWSISSLSIIIPATPSNPFSNPFRCGPRGSGPLRNLCPGPVGEHPKDPT